jgi:hypothetical protein
LLYYYDLQVGNTAVQLFHPHEYDFSLDRLQYPESPFAVSILIAVAGSIFQLLISSSLNYSLLLIVINA